MLRAVQGKPFLSFEEGKDGLIKAEEIKASKNIMSGSSMLCMAQCYCNESIAVDGSFRRRLKAR